MPQAGARRERARATNAMVVAGGLVTGLATERSAVARVLEAAEDFASKWSVPEGLPQIDLNHEQRSTGKKP
jgi:hypothetical protein